MKGYHKRPIITGITPTYIPMRANVDACPTVGRAQQQRATLLLNLVPSSVVIPITYGSPAFQMKGIVTLASASLDNVRPGSIAQDVSYHLHQLVQW